MNVKNLFLCVGVKVRRGYNHNVKIIKLLLKSQVLFPFRRKY
jgi:hypothetical protein